MSCELSGRVEVKIHFAVGCIYCGDVSKLRSKQKHKMMERTCMLDTARWHGRTIMIMPVAINCLLFSLRHSLFVPMTPIFFINFYKAPEMTLDRYPYPGERTGN